MIIVNPLKHYEDLDKACKAMGFDVKLPSRYIVRDVYIISNRILEIRFSDITVRKALYRKDFDTDIGISGVYVGGYPADCKSKEFSHYEGQNGRHIENKELSYVSIWDVDKKYSYSVYAPKGLKHKSMCNWEKNFR